jgi:hypothetical protein
MVLIVYEAWVGPRDGLDIVKKRKKLLILPGI